MAYAISTPSVGFPEINESILLSGGYIKPPALGTIVRAVDPTYGEGEFIFLKGVASAVVGSWVIYNSDSWTTSLLVPDAIGPVAVAMAAHTDATYGGWFQIHGKADALAADVSDSGKVYIDTDAGTCDDAVVAGDKVFNATWASDDSTATGRAFASVARPFCTDEST